MEILVRLRPRMGNNVQHMRGTPKVGHPIVSPSTLKVELPTTGNLAHSFSVKVTQRDVGCTQHLITAFQLHIVPKRYPLDGLCSLKGADAEAARAARVNDGR